MIKRKHQILFIAPPLEKVGGVADFCRMLANHLSSDFRVIYLGVGSREERQYFIDRWMNFNKGLFLLLQILNKQKFDVIHINPSFKLYSLIRDSFYLFLINLFHFGGKTIVFFHGWDQSLVQKVRENALWRLIFIHIYRKIGVVIVLFKSCREQLTALGLDPQKVMTMTTMYEAYDSDPKKKELLEKSKNGKLQILFMSRFLKEKGVFIAAEVARILAEQGREDFRLIFAGEGPEDQHLRDFIVMNKLDRLIETPGFVSGETKKNILIGSDIFFFPTYYGEGCPIVILEAMGAGLAIVSTPAGAIPEVVEQNENGFIIKSREPKDFVEAITRLMDDRYLLKNIQEVNRKKAAEIFEAKVVSKKIEELYLSVANG